MDKAKCCPKCNYNNKMEAEFEVCPRCGIIVAKYMKRISKPDAVIESSNQTSSLPIQSQSTHEKYLMKKIISGVLKVIVLIVALIAIYRYFETTSGTIVWSQTSAGIFRVTALATDENFIYIVGEDSSLGFDKGLWRIEKRKLSDGFLVNKFGIGGAVTCKLGDRSAWITGVAVDAQYLYVIGVDNSPSGYQSQWRMEKRRLMDGSPVEEFGNAGVVTSPPSQFLDGPSAIAIDAHYMYVGGLEYAIYESKNTQQSQPDYYQWRIEKIRLSDGSLDSDFGTGGVIRNNSNIMGFSPGEPGTSAIAIDANYMYVIGKGINDVPTDTHWIINKMRLTDGSYCKEFGNNGVVMQNPSPGYDEPHGLAIDEKHMYIVGHDMSPGGSIDHQWHIEKRNLFDGALVGEFGNNGIVTNNPSNRVDWANAIVLDRKPGLWKSILDFDLFGNRQAMYVIGSDRSPDAGDQEWRIEKRRLSNGSFVSAFGNAGSLTINPSSNSESTRAIAADAYHIYVAGDETGLGRTDYRCRIVKIKK